MKDKFCYLVLMTLLLAGCRTINAASTTVPPPESSATPPLASTKAVIPTNSVIVTPTATLSPTTVASPTSSSVPPTAVPTPEVQPIISQQAGDLYETVFTIPVGGNSMIQYRGSWGAEISGPNAIAVLPDSSFMIADTIGIRLLRFDLAGELISAIDLKKLGIRAVRDLRTDGNKLFVFEPGTGPDPQRYWVRQISFDGTLIANDEIPIELPLDEVPQPQYGGPIKIIDGMTGIAVDCEGNIVLEIAGGYKLYRLVDIQNTQSTSGIPNGYLCNGKLYHSIDAAKPFAKFEAGDITYSTQLTTGYGGLSALGIFQDGSLYLERQDVVTESVIEVDQTVHYFSVDGAIRGVARVPLSEIMHPISRSIAIGPTGDVFVMLLRQNLVEIIRLNFYTQLEPLIPGAQIPQITVSPNTP